MADSKGKSKPALPQDFDALRALTLARQSELPKRLAQVAEYALTHPDEIAFGTTTEIAAKAEVQPSTLVRFAKTLGYAGFSDLQEVFRSRLKDRWPNYQERLAALRQAHDPRSGSGALLDGFVGAAAASLQRLHKTTDPQAIDQAAEILARAETIYLLGQRRAFPIATYLAYAFAKLHIRTVLISNLASLGSEEAAFAGPRDAALAISFTPYTPVTLGLAASLKERQVPLIAMTDSPFSPLAPAASVLFEVVETDFAGFRALSASLCLAMTLAVAVGERRANL
ncbi:MurR/RpiR family transcriptional regulator [Dongia sp.]|uniref:MurR/RpiR family transcriptional regulator n=1 Tax=Dongia sp. TaxID=1977262 RepID=UPI0035B4B6D2